ncbi:hypothetical protein CcCBS67573_g02365 [Chytriomyces confervae]|uniref:CCDC113/CCDC96 coiled-coil domain-containing protein n=1 Tax=Chytriomyces confervae TaxID=246404 RepID=A0A507FMW4_9FUNG|nr:Coiled-coil domain-containing protein 96 [Chytriomyces hyalinus]TPX76367.1 hypothetical protein CcCBS67573_g02365 [Chytriomyces confervae]
MADTDAPATPATAEKPSTGEAGQSSIPSSKRASKAGSIAQLGSKAGSKTGSRKASVVAKSGSKRASVTVLSQSNESAPKTPSTESPASAPNPPENSQPTSPDETGAAAPSTAAETPPTENDPNSTSTDQAAVVLTPEEQEARADLESMNRLQSSLTEITATLTAELQEIMSEDAAAQSSGNNNSNNNNSTELAHVGEEIEIIPAVTRTLTSPLLSASDISAQQGFTFVSLDYEVDLDMDPDAIVVSGLSGMPAGTAAGAMAVVPPSQRLYMRSGSFDLMVASIARQATDTEEKPKTAVVRVRTPMMRPTSPTLSEEEVKRAEAAALEAAGSMPHSSGDGVGAVPQTLDAAAIMEMVEEGVDREAVIASIKSELDLKEKFRIRNAFLQNKLGEYFKRKRTDDAHDGEKSVADQEQRYSNCMTALLTLRTEYESLNNTNAKIVNEYKAKLEEHSAEAHDKSDEFVKFKRTIALSAENSRTGKCIPPKTVAQLEATDQRKEMEVVSVRLDHIKLRNKLKRHEQLLRQKEELADGLHLIDFEQLKIENQTYNEKIEERNEELLKLRKKITNIVQVLTHVKEKLQFVQAENGSLRKDLKSLDGDVAVLRDSLPSSKQSRDSIKNLNTSLRQKNGLLGNKPLLRDYEDKVDETDSLKMRIDELRTVHANLSAETLSIKRQIQRKLII